MMGKKKQLMAALNSMGSAYMRALVALSNQRERHEAIVDAMTNGMRRLTEERDAALADVKTLTEADAEANLTIYELRDDLANTRELLDAAFTEAARMRKDWSGDVTAAREVIERKSNEIAELRRTLDELQEHASQWGTLCFRLGIAQASHIDAVIAAAQAQAAPVVDQDLKR